MKEKIDALKDFLLLPEWADRYTNYFVELGIFTCNARGISGTGEPDRLQFDVVFLRVPYSRPLLYICFCQCAIPAGLAAMLFNLCDGVPRKDIRDNMPYLLATLKELGLIDNLTLSRRVALLTMVEKITNS